MDQPQYDFSSLQNSVAPAETKQAPQYDFSSLTGKQPKTLNEAINPEQASLPITTQLANQAKAIAIGGFHGEDRFITTLLKAGSKYLGLGTSPEAVQATYDANSATYDKSMKDHPISTIIGDIVGTTAGLFATRATALPAAEGAGIGSLSALGKLGLSAASMAGQGAVMGGLSTSPGQNSQTIINVPGAKQGAATGALFGGVVQPAVASYLRDTGKLAAAQKDALLNGGYNGKQFMTDQPSNSWIDTVKQWTENNILQKLPGILGTSGGRNLQQQQINTAMSKYINNLSTNTANVGPKAVGTILDKHFNEIKQQYDQAWGNFTNTVPDVAVSATTSTPILNNIKDLIKNNKPIDTGLTTKDLSIISKLPSNEATPIALNEGKKQAWEVYSKLQSMVNKGSDNPVITELADNTRQLYWNYIDDMKNGLKNVEGTDSPALQAFNDANQFTKNFKQLFDPKNRPQLIAAIKDSSDQTGKVSDFMRWLNSPTTSSNEIGQVNKVLGQTGQQAAAGYGLQQLYQKSMQDINGQSSFNLSTFLDGLNKIERSPQQKLYQPALDAMSGLRRVATDFAANTNAQASGEANNLLQKYGPAAVIGSMGAAAHSAGVASLSSAGILLAPAVMSFVAKNSPVKNMLIQISKFAGQEPTSLMNFLSTRVLDTLSKAGIQLINDGSGNISLDKQEIKKGTQRVSLNDYSPLVPHNTTPKPASQLPQPITSPVKSLFNPSQIA